MNVTGNPAHYPRAVKGFTIAVLETNGGGTHHVQFYEVEDIEEAKQDALSQCAADWEHDDIEGLAVLFVAKGKVTFEEYQEPWM